MLTIQQINSLRADRQYKKTMSAAFNWKYSVSFIGDPGFSVLDINFGGKPYQQLNIVLKALICIFKKCIISKEIGMFRNAIIERILNSTVNKDFMISSLIEPDMKWVEAKVEKIVLMMRLTEKFVTEPEIQQIIFNVIGMTDNEKQKDFMGEFLREIKNVFIRQIAELMRDVYLKSENDYNLFLKMNEQYFSEKIKDLQFGGNLTGNFISNKTGGESNV